MTMAPSRTALSVMATLAESPAPEGHLSSDSRPWRRSRHALALASAGTRSYAAPEPGWNLAGLQGRLVELCDGAGAATLTLAMGLVRDTQRQGDSAAWVGDRASCFFPPDATAGGVDLETLAVVRVPERGAVPRAAAMLAQSGAFGLVVLDLGGGSGDGVDVPMPLQSRLLGLAQKHAAAIVFLTGRHQARARPGSLGSLISLRATSEVRRPPAADHRGGAWGPCEGPKFFVITLRAVKDKRRAPGWIHEEVCRAPPGLR